MRLLEPGDLIGLNFGGTRELFQVTHATLYGVTITGVRGFVATAKDLAEREAVFLGKPPKPKTSLPRNWLSWMFPPKEKPITAILELLNEISEKYYKLAYGPNGEISVGMESKWTDPQSAVQSTPSTPSTTTNPPPP